MSDTTSTGIAPGFGGFATTPNGQMQYWNRQHNPYAFLQQQPQIAGGLGDNAPAASQEFARGGMAGVSPQQEQGWAKFMRYHQMARYRRGGAVWQRLDDGGDAGTDSGTGGGQGNDGSQAGDQAGGFNDGGFGPGTGQNADGGFDAGFGNAVGTAAEQAGSVQNSPFDAPGLTIGQGTLGFNNEEVDPRGLGIAALGKGITSAVPGLSAAMSLGKSVGFDPVGQVTNAAGGHALGPGASVGSSVLGGIGGAVAGPVGAVAGSVVGGLAGANGEMGGGALGGTGSTAGTAGTATNTSGPASNAPDGFGVNLGMDAATSGSNVGLGNPGGAVQTQDINSGVSEAADLAALIKKINSALQSGASSGGYARGGSVAGRAAPNRAFHRGSGLVQGTSDGRADALHTHVPQGSYVVPADVVSGLGQGNTMAGAKKLAGLMPQNTPPLPDDPGMAGGGMVPVRLSAGEFHIHPAHVAALGGGSIKAGSDKLDQMVGHVRTANARQVATMPPPR